MGLGKNVGKYEVGRIIGEGTFGKVKVARDAKDGRSRQVAIKIIDKHMVKENNLKQQVQREITTMKLLRHPNIVQIHEVIGSKTKIYIVMEYVSGGQLSNKLSYVKRMSETEARKAFHQLIDAVNHCHQRGVFHRDLKPENLLLDTNGNLKVSDFGLSALRKPGLGDMLSTACGSPSYVAPELLMSKGYEGAGADVWSCGVILFELLAGYLPFDHPNLMQLYRKISRAEYICPLWFTESQKTLIARIFDPNPKRRITVPEIIQHPWFQIDYNPSFGYDLDDTFDSTKMTEVAPSFINAFQLIAMSDDLDLSALFQQDEKMHKERFGAKHTIDQTMQKIQDVATCMSLSVEKMSNFGMKIICDQKKVTRSYFELSAEVTEVAPTYCVVEISKSTGEIGVYKEFCRSLSSLLIEEESVRPLQEKESDDVIKIIQESGRHES